LEFLSQFILAVSRYIHIILMLRLFLFFNTAIAKQPEFKVEKKG